MGACRLESERATSRTNVLLSCLLLGHSSVIPPSVLPMGVGPETARGEGGWGGGEREGEGERENVCVYVCVCVCVCMRVCV